MKVYKVYVRYWEYWHAMEHSGYTSMERFFTTKEKAEEWAEKIKHIKRGFNYEYIYTYGYKNESKPEYYEPKITITEVEIDNMERP